jgi:hypothetical protein
MAADGSVWAAGNVNPRGGVDPDKEHGVLRHYDKTGRLLRSLFPAASIDRLRPYMGFVATSSDRAGWYRRDRPTHRDRIPGRTSRLGTAGRWLNTLCLPCFQGKAPICTVSR